MEAEGGGGMGGFRRNVLLLQKNGLERWDFQDMAEAFVVVWFRGPYPQTVLSCQDPKQPGEKRPARFIPKPSARVQESEKEVEMWFASTKGPPHVSN